MKFVLVGSVSTTVTAFEAFRRINANLVGVLGLHPKHRENVSGFDDLCARAAAAGISFSYFSTINSPEVLTTLKVWNPDYLFVIGLSQLLSAETLSAPSKGCIGFHPTWLPRGRGRAPVAWLVLECLPGAATLFQMDEGADSGPILAQAPFFVSEMDYAEDVLEKANQALASAMDQLLPALIAGTALPVEQDSTLATSYGKRGPEDGRIEWNSSASEISALVRATSAPHPGAFTYFKGEKVIIWRASALSGIKSRGVVGRVLRLDENNCAIVQTGDGHLRIESISFEDPASALSINVGAKLGFDPEYEIYQLRRRVAELERTTPKSK